MNIAALSMGLAINVLTLSMHAVAVMFLLPWFKARVERLYGRGRKLASVAMLSIAISGLLLLQLASGMIWALVYDLLGVTHTMRESDYLALTAISALGGDAAGAQSPWRVLLPLTSINGALLFGLSTAVMFRLVSAVHSVEESARGV